MDAEGAAGDFVRTSNQPLPFQIDELPVPALKHLFKFLNWEDQKCMRELCTGMRYFIEYEYGIHAYWPARHCGYRQRSRVHTIGGISLVIMNRMITEVMMKQAIEGLEGKVIRSLEMYEMPPDYNPFPLQRFIQYPWRLRLVYLKYVDISFLLALLSSCRNLSDIRYETGVHRVLTEEGMQPVPIPTEEDQLIQLVTQLPNSSFQVDRLTSLSLRLKEVDPNRHSDWANVVFLLLSLSQMTLISLRNFKFGFDYHGCLISRDHLQIVACIGQFLSRCPSLCNLEYASTASRDLVRLGRWVGAWEDELLGPTLPQTVLSGLIRKYGSVQLKEMQGVDALGVRERMLTSARTIMRDAGGNLRNLQDVTIDWRFPFEAELFQFLLSAVPSPTIREIDICDQTGQSLTGGSYDLLLAQSIQPLYENVRKLRVCRMENGNYPTEIVDDTNRALSLPRILDRMRALNELFFVPRTGLGEDREEDEPYYSYLHQDRNDFETPDVTFEEVGDVHFQQLQVLELRGVKISIHDAGRLIQLRNLKVLDLYVLPEYRHQLFGINSENLIRLMGTLRKLKKLSVNMILFPEDEILKSAQCTALQGIGSLKQMRRLVVQLNNGNIDIHTEVMAQYKFRFGYKYDEIDDDDELMI